MLVILLCLRLVPNLLLTLRQTEAGDGVVVFVEERLLVAVEGSARNIKITREEDLALAEAILKSVVSS